MPRKAFIADITAASEKVISNILDVRRGDDDGDIQCVFTPASGAPISIGLLALDVSGYPAENNFMIFTNSSDIPPGVNEALQDVANFSPGMRISELLQTMSQRLTKLLASGSQSDPVNIEDDDSDVQMLDGVDEDEGDEESAEEYDTGYDSDEDGGFGFGPAVGRTSLSSAYSLSPAIETKLNRRIKEDLRAVKFAGFKVGILSGLKADSHTSMLSISLQAAKLGLSEEALQAWDLEPQQYVVLLLRYSSGYKTFDAVIAEPAKSLEISFRIGLSNKYKPTLSEALAAFTDVTQDDGKPPAKDGSGSDDEEKPTIAGFNTIFISSSLNEFINDQFVSLLKIRYSSAIGWDGAKHFFNDRQGRLDEKNSTLPEHYYNESEPKQKSLPDMMTADHLTENFKELSFPLIAAQFSMRYLLRCTEFCLVCHDQIQGDFEALKPYVCDKPLCLYQYMSLGFGPSVEHEILTQPYVVDLLVSFCYCACYSQRIREYPTGMSLSVPPVSTSVTQQHNARYQYQLPAQNPQTIAADTTIEEIDVKFDLGHQEVLFDGQNCPVRNGDWVVITEPGAVGTHYRVEDISLFPTVRLSNTPITPGGGAQAHTTPAPATPATTPPPPALIPAKMSIYDQNFDEMSDVKKAETIVVLLNTLPSITDLRQFLLKQTRTSEPNLRAWKERISPAALGLLRWIIASNRSCIVQVDRCPGQESVDANVSKIRVDQKCSNVDANWLQFRFAQGSPDKEQRFLNALRAEQGNFDSKYPTMFAFHGSPIQNWHSIIRHGLDFKDTMHGRAYGHGVYHAMDQLTSVGYAQSGSGSWPSSELKITTAMSLNEIVNCPTQFTSSNPYMVVQHVDWIQARYLFVQTTNVRAADWDTKNGNPEVSASETVAQDPKFTAKTSIGKPIGVPRCAISISRAFRTDAEATKPASKRQKVGRSKLTMQDLAVSDGEEIEDLTFLFSDVEDSVDKSKGKVKEKPATEKAGGSFLKSLNPFGKPKSKVPEKPMTDFVPGSLDQASLPMLDEPTYATPMATMRINKDLKELLKIQKTTPLHELGWYLNPELVNNVYQWIVELHSFDAALPLAKDMKAAGMTSVVLEVRFPKEYPHSPPFIRVIRPRFLPFTQGGGGHVTGGGAMCMELLTNTGWSSVSSIEGVLLQVRMAIQNLEPKPARLENQSTQYQMDYGTGEAMDAYIRACRAHGWEVPKDFQNFASGSGDNLGVRPF